MISNGVVAKTTWTSTTGTTAVWVPTTGKRWRLSSFCLYATADAANSNFGASRTLTVTLYDGATDLGISWPIYIGTGAAWSSGFWADNGPPGTLASSAVNTTLNLNLSGPLTAGKVGLYVVGFEDN